MVDERLLNEVIEEKKKDYELYKKLNSDRFPLEGPFEAYYFKAIRNFFTNSISHRVMNNNQDTLPKIYTKR